jgi:hypothetical protein
MAIRNVIAHAMRVLAALLLVVVCNTTMAQELYKWTDEHGNVHYGDKPPASQSAEAGTPDVQSVPRPNTNIGIPVSVETSTHDGVVRYVLKTNEILSSHSSTPSRIVISDDVLWLPFRESVLAFEPQSRQLTKYTIDRSQRGIAAQLMNFSGNKFIFPETDSRYIFPETDTGLGNSAFRLYDYENDVYSELPIPTRPSHLITYDDTHGNGIFGYSYRKRTLLQFPSVAADAAENKATAFERVIAVDIPGITVLSASSNMIWHAYGYRTPCVASSFDKQTERIRTFTSDDIGGSTANGCLAIVADENEVWLSAPDEKDRRIKNTTFSVYDIHSEQWETIPKPESNPGPFAVSLQMDDQRVYYVNCQRIVAVNRSTKHVTAFSFDDFSFDQTHTSCINVLRVTNGLMWALKFEEDKLSKRYPVLYAIPTEKMNP